MAIRGLLIDDDERLFELLASFLEQHGVDLAHARDGRRGLVELGAGVWLRVDAHAGCRRLVALPLRTMGVGRALGLDVDRRFAVGLRAVSLRALGTRAQSMVLGAGPAACAGGVCACAGGLGWRIGRECLALCRWRAWGGVVPARAA